MSARATPPRRPFSRRSNARPFRPRRCNDDAKGAARLFVDAAEHLDERVDLARGKAALQPALMLQDAFARADQRLMARRRQMERLAALVAGRFAALDIAALLQPVDDRHHRG